MGDSRRRSWGNGEAQLGADEGSASEGGGVGMREGVGGVGFSLGWRRIPKGGRGKHGRGVSSEGYRVCGVLLERGRKREMWGVRVWKGEWIGCWGLDV